MLNDSKELIKHNLQVEYMKRRSVSHLIEIYEGKFNNIGLNIGKSNPLSKTWFEEKQKKNVFIFGQLKKNTENYFRTITQTESADNMYTVFKPYSKYIKGKGYSKGFVACNARGTNNYRDKKSLAYLLNYFIHPDIRQFINHYNIDFNGDLFSLSALLQWIWRSQIRDGKTVQIYIPSERMRGLLQHWICECNQTDKIA